VRILRDVGANILGTVMNNVKDDMEGYSSASGERYARY
jgi:hypothetical protein